MAQKICIVTGASRGIGRGIALVLASKGHIVYATARGKESLANLASEVASKGGKGKVIACACDHSIDSSFQKVVKQVLDSHNKIDLLVNNAYGGVNSIAENFGKGFWEKPLSVWDASHNVGLRSHYVATCCVVPSMIKNGSGLVINISSSGGMGYLFDVAYGCGKAALDRMGADMATELQGTSVRVVTLWPGAVNTETTTFPNGESVEFTGRGVAALLSEANSNQLDKYNGRVVMVSELAQTFRFTDVDGSSIPSLEQNQRLRKSLDEKPPVQWSQQRRLPRPAAIEASDFFKSSKL